MKKFIFAAITSLMLIMVLAPASIVSASSQNVLDKDIASMRNIPAGIPYTIYYTDQGKIREIKLGVPAGFKVEALDQTESFATPFSTGLHNKDFYLSNTNRTWRDNHSHTFSVGDRQWQEGYWSPDQSTSCFSGVYNVAGNYAIGYNVTSPYSNLIVTIGTAGEYRTQFTYNGFTTVHVYISYFPWW